MSPLDSAFEARLSASFHQETDQLHDRLTVEVDKLRTHYLVLLTEYLEHIDAILKEAHRAAFPRHTELLRTLSHMLQKPPLEYRLEVILEDIKSKIVVSETLRWIKQISPTDYPLLLAMQGEQQAFLRPEPRAVRFELTETNSGKLKPAIVQKSTIIRDWLCRNCMRINQHMAKSCSLCGFQRNNQQADG